MKLYIALPVLAFAFAIGGCQSNQVATENLGVENNEVGIDVSTLPEAAGSEAYVEGTKVDSSGQMVAIDGSQQILKTVDLSKNDLSQPPIAVNMSIVDGGLVPNVIRVPLGRKIQINVLSQDDDYGISIDGYGINKAVPYNGQVQIEFIAETAGTFNMFCNHNCDENLNDGQLIVE